MLQSEECLKKERERVAHYLHSSSEPKLVEVSYFTLCVIIFIHVLTRAMILHLYLWRLSFSNSVFSGKHVLFILIGICLTSLFIFCMQKVQHELLVVYANQLLEKEHSGCRALLRDDKVEQLSLCFYC